MGRDRYKIPEILCNHKKLVVRIEAGNPSDDSPYASVWVCDRDDCIEDAKQWAYASTHIIPIVIRE